MKTVLFLVFFGAAIAVAADPRIEARQRAKEAAVQSAGINRALSKEMPAEVRALPVFGKIEWTLQELPFIGKGPHAGISGAGMVVAGDQIYLAGGFIPEGDGTEEVGYRTSRWSHRFDLESGQWTQLPDLPARREYTRAIAADGMVYVLGGAVQGKPAMPSADVFRLDPKQSPLRWQTMAPMQVARTHMAVGKVGRWLIVVGGNKYDFAQKGYSPATIQGVTEVFDLTQPEKGWVTRAPIPGSPRGWSASAVVGGKFYVFGGVTWTAKGRERLAEALCYDPARDEWEKLPDFPMPISGWEGEVLADRYIVVVGGAGSRWNDVPFVFDTKTARWMRVESPLPPGGFYNDPGVCIVGDTIYVAGGEGPGGSHFNHFLVGRLRPAAEQSATQSVETRVISQQPHHYHGWPTLARSKDGTLAVVYSGGRDFHVCPFGRLEMIISNDEGKTWAGPRVLFDSAIDDRDAGIVETSQGTLLATMFNSFVYQVHMNAPERLVRPTFGAKAEALLARWRTMDAATTAAQKEAAQGYWMLRSSDRGVTWSQPYRVPGYSPHGPVSLLDGRLFYATSNGKKAEAHVSEDDGLTWKAISDMPVRAGELHAVQAADGAIVVQVRDKISESNKTVQNTAQILSTDGGKTWSEKVKVADGFPSHLLRLRDGTLLMTYGWRQAPFGIRGRISTDHARTWQKEFTLTTDGESADLGYPSTVELRDGSLLTVWYEVMHEKPAVLRQARWNLNTLQK